MWVRWTTWTIAMREKQTIEICKIPFHNGSATSLFLRLDLSQCNYTFSVSVAAGFQAQGSHEQRTESQKDPGSHFLVGLEAE